MMEGMVSEAAVPKTVMIGATYLKANRTATGLQTMQGVGPLTAMAVEAVAPDMSSFRRGRDFADWLGLVPRQHSSSGKERLGCMSKAG